VYGITHIRWLRQHVQALLTQHIFGKEPNDKQR